MLNLSTTYPGQVVTTDPDFPLGKPRNQVEDGDGTGTPWEEKIAQDIYGALQALVGNAGITVSGNPDNASASDVLQSILTIARREAQIARVGRFYLQNKSNGVLANYVAVSGKMRVESGSPTPGDTEFYPESGAWTLSSDEITLPRTGVYSVHLHTPLLVDDTASPLGFNLSVRLTGASPSGAIVARATGERWSNDTARTASVNGFGVFQITNTSLQRLFVQNDCSAKADVPILTGSEKVYSPLIITYLGNVT